MSNALIGFLAVIGVLHLFRSGACPGQNYEISAAEERGARARWRPTIGIGEAAAMRMCALIVSLLSPCVVFGGYDIPTIDERKSSPPTVSGEVLEIIGNILLVESRGEEISVLTDGNTHIFTDYGGLVLLHEICEGSNIAIWYKSPRANRRIAPAVSIRVPGTC